MNYCALEDAYQEIGAAPTPGCSSDYATKMARKEERRKARKCKGPAATYLDINDDNPAISANSANSGNSTNSINSTNSKKETNDTNKKEQFKHTPVNHDNPYPTSNPKYDKDPLYDYTMNESNNHFMTIPTNTDLFKSKSYFGKGCDDDEFADYIPDQDNYRLQPDFLTAFEQSGVARAGSAAILSKPSTNMFWKPHKNGVNTSFVEHLPPGPSFGPSFGQGQGQGIGSSMNDEIMKKFDRIFARLDDMNSPSPENVTSELLMFISSGIFVLFICDLLVKKGSTMRF